MQPDRTFLRRWVRNHDADAFAELVSRHSAMVYSACKRVLGVAADAEDVAQDCFAKLALQNADIGSPGGWLYRVAVRASLDKLRSEQRRRRRERSYVANHEGVVGPVEDFDDVLALVDEAIADLPEPLRLAIVFRFLEGRTHADMARELGVSRSAVQKRIRKALDQIRTFLEKQGVPVSAGALAAIFTAQMQAEAAPASLMAALGKQTLAFRPPAATASVTHALMTGGIAMASKKSAVALGALVIAVILALLAARELEPFGAAQPSEAAEPDALAASDGTQSTSGQPVPPSEPHDTLAVAEGEPVGEDDGRLDRAEVKGQEDQDTDQPESPANAGPVDPPASISGFVRDAEAWPVAYGEVWVEAKADATGEPQATFATETEKDGRYVVSGIKASAGGRMFVRAKGYLMQRRHMPPIRAGESRADVDFTLTRALYFVRGMVVTEGGAPVSDAEVSLILTEELKPDGQTGWTTSPGPRDTFAVTDADGLFEIAVPKEALCTFCAVKAGFAEGRYANIPTGTDDARLLLRASSAVTGRVTRAGGTPAEGVVVAVVGEATYDPDSGRSYPSPPQQPKQMVSTDAKGRYRLEGLSGQVVYDLGVFGQTRDHLRQNWNDYWLKPEAYRQGIHVEGGDVLGGVDFQLPDDPYVRIKGHVWDETSGEVARKLALGCSLIEPSRFLGVATTDDAGAYELEFTLNEPAEVQVNGTYVCQLGGLSARLKRADDGRMNPRISLSPGEEIEVDFMVDAPVSIPVRVIDEAGQPISAAGVGVGFVQDSGQWDYAGVQCVRTDGDGLSLCQGLPPNRSYFVWAQESSGQLGRGHKPVPLAQHGPLEGSPGEILEEVVLVVGLKGGLEGLVTDLDGIPLSDLPIVLSVESAENDTPQQFRAQTNPDGQFVAIHALRPGVYPEIYVSASRDGQSLQGRVESVTVEADAIVDLGAILLGQ